MNIVAAVYIPLIPFSLIDLNFLCCLSGMGMKKPTLGTPPPNSCPVCGIQLSSNELETHFLAELDRLYKLSSVPERQRIRASFNLNPAMHQNNGMMQGPDSRWEVRNPKMHHIIGIPSASMNTIC